MAFVWLIDGQGKGCDRTDTWGTQVAETPEKDVQADEQPAAVQQGASSRLTVTVVSLAALAVIGAATANSIPKFDRLGLPDFDRVSFPTFDLSSLPDFDVLPSANFSWPDFSSNFSWPNLSWPTFSRVAAKPAQKTAPPAMPDPVIMAALTEIQVSQRQAATVLASLTESSAAQQAELKRISRQVTLLTVQVDSLRGAVTLTTSSIPTAASGIPMATSSDPMTTSSIPAPNPRARVIRASRRASPPSPPPLPKPVGPVSVGGAPLSPAPATGSGA
jgi:hypothetical protein